jgi:hypothetical protein
MDLAKSAGSPRAFLLRHTIQATSAAHRLIVAMAGSVLENDMVADQTSIASGIASRIVIDDRSRLPGRFFGRFATSATSELARAR